MSDPSWESSKARIARSFREVKAILDIELDNDPDTDWVALKERARKVAIEAKKQDEMLDYLFGREEGEPMWEWKLRKCGATDEVVNAERAVRERRNQRKTK